MVLAAKPDLDLPLVSLSVRHSKVVTQSGYAGRKNTVDGVLLARCRDAVFHLLDHPGVLLDADLPRPGAAHWIGDQCRRPKGSDGHGCASCDFYAALSRAHSPD